MTDEDFKAPILGKNLCEFNKIMKAEPFDLKSSNSFVNSKVSFL